jgi:hypothetical protein
VDLATALSALDTPPPPPDPEPEPEPIAPGLASVDWIGYSISGGKKNDKNLGVTVEIVDEFGDPVPDAAVAVQIRCSGKVVYSGTPVTDDNGVALVTINGAKGGTYVTLITNVTAEGFDWDHVSPPNSFVK